MKQFTFTATPEVEHFLSLVSGGQSPTEAANQAGLSTHEALMIRKLVGLPTNGSTRDMVQKVLKLRAQGLSHKQISEHLQISQSYVNHCICLNRKQAAFL